MEHTGLEPVTSTLPVWRAPSCANAPNTDSIAYSAASAKIKIDGPEDAHLSDVRGCSACKISFAALTIGQ